MSLLYNAATVWKSLSNVAYEIVIGRKNDSRTIRLIFRNVDFDHLVGMQYAKDIDFGVQIKDFTADKLINAILDGKIDASLIEKGIYWNDKISHRLHGINSLCNLIEGAHYIYEFDSNKLPFYSKIEASYLICDKEHHYGFFVFFDEENGIYYCKSIFRDMIKDYTRGKIRWTVLKIERISDMNTEVVFTHPNYK